MNDRCPQCGNDTFLNREIVGSKLSYNVTKGVIGDALIGAPGAFAGIETKNIYECNRCGCKFVQQGNHTKTIEYGTKWVRDKRDTEISYNGKNGYTYKIYKDPMTKRPTIYTFVNAKETERLDLNEVYFIRYDTNKLTIQFFGKIKNICIKRNLGIYYFENANELHAMLEEVKKRNSIHYTKELKIYDINNPEDRLNERKEYLNMWKHKFIFWGVQFAILSLILLYSAISENDFNNFSDVFCGMQLMFFLGTLPIVLFMVQ